MTLNAYRFRGAEDLPFLLEASYGLVLWRLQYGHPAYVTCLIAAILWVMQGVCFYPDALLAHIARTLPGRAAHVHAIYSPEQITQQEDPCLNAP